MHLQTSKLLHKNSFFYALDWNFNFKFMFFSNLKLLVILIILYWRPKELNRKKNLLNLELKLIKVSGNILCMHSNLNLADLFNWLDSNLAISYCSAKQNCLYRFSSKKKLFPLSYSTKGVWEHFLWLLEFMLVWI